MKTTPKQTENKTSKPSHATAPASEVKPTPAALSPSKTNAPSTTPVSAPAGKGLTSNPPTAERTVAAAPAPAKTPAASAPVTTPPSPAPKAKPAAAETPAPPQRNAKFSLFAPEAKQVTVSGEFNAWSPEGTPLRRQQNGQWETAIVLRPGRYQYKFVADGQWIHDPQAETVPNEHGTLNSVIEVRP